MVQNLVYALIQVIHNLGAVTVVGAAAAALWRVGGDAVVQRWLAVLVAVVWAVQAASGAGFGLATFSFEGHLPDIHGLAVLALSLKIICAMCGFTLAVAYAKYHAAWSIQKRLLVWRVLFALGVTALSAAAFLRWFS